MTYEMIQPSPYALKWRWPKPMVLKTVLPVISSLQNVNGHTGCYFAESERHIRFLLQPSVSGVAICLCQRRWWTF